MTKGKSSLFLSAATLFGLGLNFLALPWLIRWIGPDGWGLYIFIQTLVLYVTLIDIGFGVAAVKRMSEAFGLGDMPAVWRVQRCYMGAQLVLGAVGAGLFLLLGGFLPFPSTRTPVYERHWLLAIVGASFFVSSLSSALSPVFVASERFVAMAVRDAIGRVLSLAFGLYAAYQYGTLLAYLLATLAGSFAGFVLNFATLKLAFSDFRLRPSFEPAVLRDLAVLGFRGYVHRIGSLLANSVHLPLMAYAGGAALPARYQLAGRIPEAMQAIVSPVSQTVLPQLTREAAQDSGSFARSVERFSMIGLALGVSLILVPAGFGYALLQIWAKNNPALDPASSLVLLILGLYFAFELFYVMLTKAFYALGVPHYMAPFSLFNGLATLALTVPVVLNFGLVGVAAQNALIDLIQLYPMLRCVRRRAVPELNVRGTLLNVVAATGIGLAIAGFAFWLVRTPALQAGPWLALALVPAFSAGTFFLLVGLKISPLPEDLRRLAAASRSRVRSAP